MFSDNASSIVSEAADGSFSIPPDDVGAKKEEMMERHGIMRRRTLDPPLAAAAAAGPACSTASPRRERVISPAAAVGLGAGEERAGRRRLYILAVRLAAPGLHPSQSHVHAMHLQLLS